MARPATPGVLGSAAGNGSTDKPKRKQTRPQGPRSLWIVLKEGTDPNTIREAIELVTFNGRVVLSNMEQGNVKPTIKFTLAAQKRGSGGADESDGDETFVTDSNVGAAPAV